ncbi:MAG: glutamine-hydrolyzing carbamoyl-phosphate synthase small subunit [Planctomycetes bacterium]|nr:glutamine-hydrolyzing carbamoyl-phosphate synthase small subunit [Planctomycetota bacterium]
MAEARFVFADGSIYRGRSVGAEDTVRGEAVFNTGMAGYQEVITDPSYTGQIVTMTYTEVGNYGINQQDMESEKAQVAGFVMRQCCDEPSNFRSEESLPHFLKRSGIVAVDGIDTRAITRRLRVAGAVGAVLSTDSNKSDEELIAEAQSCPDMTGQDLASTVSCEESYDWDEAADPAQFASAITWKKASGQLIIAIDLGIKRNILRLIKACGFRVLVVPSSTSAEEILAHQPAGVFISNGPGDPAAVAGIQTCIKAIGDSGMPVFGICLGHQIISLAYGASSYKLKFGHRGVNHPIKRLTDEAVEIASHNHGFAVDPETLPACLEMTHVNLNDQTCAGIRHKSLPIFSVQYHPEAGPGPSDPLYLFQDFTELVLKNCSAQK